MATNTSVSPSTATASRGWASLWMLGASPAFVGMATMVKLAVEHGVPLGQTLFYRASISLLMVYLWMRFTGVSFATPHWKAHLQRGTAGFIGMVAYFGGISLLPLATAVTLNFTSPLLLAAMLLVLHRERPPLRLVMTMFGGFAGIVLLLRPSYDSSQWLGSVLALGSAITAAIAALNIRSMGKLDEPISRTVAYFSLFITLGALPWFLTSNPLQMDLIGAAYMFAIGAFATAGQVLLTLAYQRGNTLVASMLGYSQVVLTSLIGIVMWDDHLDVGAWLAIALIIASGVAATKFVRSPTQPEEGAG